MKNPARTKKPSPAIAKTLSLTRVTIKSLSHSVLASVGGGGVSAAHYQCTAVCIITQDI